MDDLLTRISAALIAKDVDPRPPWYDDPVMFAERCVSWPEDQALAPYQREIMEALARRRRLAARSPHGAGKSAVCALVILWFALGRDLAGQNWKILTTAGGFRQLTAYLWPEVALWARRVNWDLVGRPPFDPRTELMLTTLRLGHGQAFAGASDDPALLEGMHADSALVVFDEAKAIPAGTWESLEGALAGQGGEAFALATSTPGSPSGVFYDICSRKVGYEDWAVRHITLEEAVSAGRISPSWAAARARQWGATSAVYQNRVLGEFCSSDEDSVIPFEWVELAAERWQAWKGSGDAPGPVTVVGCDIARMGADQTVLALRAGDIMVELRRSHHEDTMATVGRIVGVLEAHPQCKGVVDIIGLGSGVYDRLKEQGYRLTTAFNASAGTTRKDRSGELGFLNTRSAAWWNLREMLDPAFDPTLAFPPDDELIGDLSAPRYSVTSTGKIQVESKDEVRKRIGRSTDAGDAVVMATFDKALRYTPREWMDLWYPKRKKEEPKPVPLPRLFLIGEGPPDVPHPESCRRHRFFVDVDGQHRCVHCRSTPEEAANAS